MTISHSRYVGIDPGKGGGIAVLFEDGNVLNTIKMPQTEQDLLDALATLGFGVRSGSAPARAVLERVSSSPQMGVVSAFTFGKGYGALRMALAATGIPFDEVTPGKWQQVMGCRTKGDKNVSKRRAQELFPHQKITHAIADALLLAEYCRRLEARA